MIKKRRTLALVLLSAITLTIQAAAMSATAPSHSPALPRDFDPNYAGFGEGSLISDEQSALAQFTPGGLPDYSFSGDGKLLLELCLSSSAEDLVFLGLDRLMVVGYIAAEYRYGHFLLARFQTTPAGQPLNNPVYLPLIKR